MLSPEIKLFHNEVIESSETNPEEALYILQQREKANSFLQKSKFLTLSKKLASELSGRVIKWDSQDQIDFVPEPRWFLKDKHTAFIGVVWDEKAFYKGKDYEEYGANIILVEAFSKGNIIVHGNFIGSTILNLEEWENRTPIQAKALKKAKRQPLRISFVQEAMQLEIN